MMHARRGRIGMAILALAWCGCATGPHPAMSLAAKDLDCAQGKLTRHEIYPKKQRIEGCGKEAIYIKGCDGYGVGAQCGWRKAKPSM